MPPAISDNEDASDIELDALVVAPTKKTAGREKKKPATYKEVVPEDDDEGEDFLATGAENEDAAEDDDDDELEGEEYVVEKILSHMINDKREPLFEVKWEGYEKKSDRTWEPEDNLRENASIILSDYLEKIGGRDRLFVDTASALKSKKRGRPTSGTPAAPGKRTKKNGGHPADLDAPLAARSATWKPPAGSWEDHIAQLDACEDEESGKLMVYLTWKNGHKTQHETSVIYNRCPQKMLQFYERHVRIIKREYDADSITSPRFDPDTAA
ncbi:hypothetical protein B0T25DRAFT_240300 [Lasiosphaeria hispida]|uniref:Chromo domain-containing protein n=1 Tax=Lasiosphaeria hispida TaxID=260671 RepID=A0AAJ0MC82_9PEZI|nr:hypothetical protein B0T25DRAFT_240300 [Lasiosphaeria hispida]